MEILNQAMEFTQQYSLFFLAGMFAVILILVICMTVMNSRMKELQAAYDDFMRLFLFRPDGGRIRTAEYAGQ